MEELGKLLDGMPKPDYLRKPGDPPWCKICNDTRWVMVKDEKGVERAKRCECTKTLKAINLLKQSGMPQEWFRDYTLKGMEMPTKEYRASIQKITQWLTGYKPGNRGLLLYGRAGAGKTRVLAACLRALILKQSIECRYYDARLFLSLIRSTYHADTDLTEASLIASFVSPVVVALDELVIPRTDWEREMMLVLIGERYRTGRTILVATNHTPEELSDEMDERIVSRLMSMTSGVEMNARDFREHNDKDRGDD